MKKEEKILINYILYFITFFVICLIGISGVFAETISNMLFSQFRTTVSSYGITSNQFIYDTTSAVPVNMGVSPNGFAFEWITNYTNKCSGQTIINGQMAIPNDNLNYDWLEENIKDIYYAPNINGVDGTPCSYSISPSNMIISFTCSTAQPNNNFIIGGHLKYRTNTNFNTYFRIYRNFNITCDNSASAIIDNQSQNTQNIINNNNNNTQNIINNNDENTQKIIDSNKVCSSFSVTISSSTKNDFNTVGYLNTNGTINGNIDFMVSNYISITKDFTYFLNRTRNEGSATSYCLYNSNKDLINCSSYGNNLSINIIPSQNGYIRFSGYTGSSYNVNTTLSGENCENGSQAINETSKGILGKLKDLFNNLFSNEDADISGLDNMVGWLPPGPVDSIINLPLSFFNALTNTLTGTCQSVSLNLPFVNKQLTLPCFDAYMTEYLTGFSTLWTLIGFIASVFILYYYLLALYKWIDDTLTMRENNLPGYYDDNWGGGA